MTDPKIDPNTDQMTDQDIEDWLEFNQLIEDGLMITESDKYDDDSAMGW